MFSWARRSAVCCVAGRRRNVRERSLARTNAMAAGTTVPFRVLRYDYTRRGDRLIESASEVTVCEVGAMHGCERLGVPVFRESDRHVHVYLPVSPFLEWPKGLV